METSQTLPEATTQPKVGNYYRDVNDSSFVILSLDKKDVLVEFADGAIRRISLQVWQEMQPNPAPF